LPVEKVPGFPEAFRSAGENSKEAKKDEEDSDLLLHTCEFDCTLDQKLHGLFMSNKDTRFARRASRESDGLH
jgi:hypothetical protein